MDLFSGQTVAPMVRAEVGAFTMDTLEQLIGSLRQRLEQARRAKRICGNDLALADRLARAISTAPLLPSDGQDSSGRQTNYQRVREHFLSTGNKWASVAEVARSTGISKAIVCQQFYNTHSADVESQPYSAHQRIKLWRLKEAPETGEKKNSV